MSQLIQLNSLQRRPDIKIGLKGAEERASFNSVSNKTDQFLKKFRLR